MSSSSSPRYPAERPTFPLYLLPSIPFPRRRTAPRPSVLDFLGAPSQRTSPASPLSPTSLPQSGSPSSTSTAASSTTPHRGIQSSGSYPPSSSSEDNYAEIWLDASPESYPLTLESTASSSSTAQTTPSTSPPADIYPKLGSAILGGVPLSQSKTGLHKEPETLRCASCSTDIAFASQIISKGFTGRHGRAYLLSPLPPAWKGLGVGLGAENCATTNSPQVPQTSRFSLLDPFSSFSSGNSSHTEDHEDAEKGSRYDLLNITTHEPSRRQLVTGLHVVADISCRVCEKVLGWKYVDASEEGQRYKIGKFILETRRVVAGRSWEDKDKWEDTFSDVKEKKLEFMLQNLRNPFVGKGKGKGRGEVEVDKRVWGDGRENLAGNEDVEFDSGDEEECEEIFKGTWDREVVRRRRAKRVELDRMRKVG